ncbi:MAG: two-component regulator propeller domain-containing protein [Cyclobacteriaceae bacterium]
MDHRLDFKVLICKNIRRIVSVLFFCSLANIQVSAFENELKFDHLSIESGLSQSSVFCIYQDNLGFIWIGTRDGLNKYDGIRFKEYNQEENNINSLTNSQINHIEQDFNGDIWISTENGLNRYCYKSDSIVRYALPDIEEKSSIYCTFEDADKRLWIGTRHGIYFYDRQHDTIIASQDYFNNDEIPQKLISSILQDTNGNMWIGSISEGLFRFEPKSKKLVHINSEYQDILAHHRIEDLVEDSLGNVWIATYGGGVYLWDANNQALTSLNELAKHGELSSRFVRSLTVDQNQNVWIGTFEGLNIYNPQSSKISNIYADDSDERSLSHNSIRSLMTDRKGSVWIGTYIGGINIFDEDNQKFVHYYHKINNKNSLSFNVVSAVVEDQHQNLWIGTESGGLNYYNRANNTFTHYTSDKLSKNGLSHNTIKSLLLDSQDKLWIGTHTGGLNLLNLKSKEFIQFDGQPDFGSYLDKAIINDLYIDSKGYLWLCVDKSGGLFKFDRKSNRYIEFKMQKSLHALLGQTSVKSVFQDELGNFWLSTEGKGIVVFNEESGYLEQFKSNPNQTNSLNNDLVYHIFQDSKRRIWVSTYGGGLNLFDRFSKTFTNFNTTHGILHNKVYGVVEDSFGYLWLSTIRGLTRFNPDTKEFKNFNYSGGFPLAELNEGAFYKSHTKKLYFGGNNGFVEFAPQEIKDNNFLPPIVFTGFRLFNQPVLPNDGSGIIQSNMPFVDKIELKYNQSIFTVEFAGLSFTHPENNQYAYKLEGIEDEWNLVKNQFSATYTLLNSGDYTFRLKASNNDGLWNENESKISISVLPPPWKTWWAYLIYAVCISGILVLMRYYSLKSEKIKTVLHLQSIEKKKIQEIHEAKIDFFTLVSHEFSTPLTLIIGQISNIMSTLKSHNPLKPRLHNVQQNALLLKRLINQLMDFRRLETGKVQISVSRQDWVSYSREIAGYFTEYAKAKGIHFTMKSRQKKIEGWFDKKLMERTLFNILSNAFKNTPEDGKIRLIIEQIDAWENHNDLIEGHITVGSLPSSNDSKLIKICISDTGNGLNHEMLAKVFDRFFQVQESTGTGTGIGLYLVKSYVNLHQGIIDIISEPNKGTEFTIVLSLGNSQYSSKQVQTQELKIVNSDDAVSLVPENYAVESKEIQTPANNKFIYIIEKDPQIGQFLFNLLAGEYHIEIFENGKDALQKMHIKLPDLVISEIDVKGIDGKKLCSKIRANATLKRVPFVILTAHQDEQTRKDCYAAGASDYIIKPFDTELLLFRIKNLLVHGTDVQKHVNHQELAAFDVQGYEENIMYRIRKYVRDNISDTTLNVNKLSREVGLSRVQIYRKIKKLTGKTAVEYIREIRLEEAAHLLLQKKLNVNDIAFLVGFQDVDYFRIQFKKKYQVSPARYYEYEKSKLID